MGSNISPEFQIELDKTGKTAYIFIISFITTASAILNAACIVERVFRKKPIVKTHESLCLQLYFADIGSLVQPVVCTVLQDYLRVEHNWTTYFIYVICMFPDICVFTTTLLTACRLRAISKPIAANITKNTIVAQCCMSLAVPLVANIAFSTSEISDLQRFWRTKTNMRVYTIFLAAYTALLLVLSLSNLAFYAGALYLLRQIVLSRNADLNTITRACQERRMMRRLILGALNNSLFLIQNITIMKLYVFDGNQDSMPSYAILPSYIYFFGILMPALLNPFIYTNWSCISRGLKIMTGQLCKQLHGRGLDVRGTPSLPTVRP